ncbi:MAG: hypothetical protein QNJ97_00530 [Myxococcota bacterium]|nr:hypothetical protein [Myxococcota bacterium]
MKLKVTIGIVTYLIATSVWANTTKDYHPNTDAAHPCQDHHLPESDLTEVADSHSPESAMQNRTEWVRLQAGFGFWGFSLSWAAVNLRWDRFYWQAIRGSIYGDLGTDLDAARGWHIGTGIGVPFLLGYTGRHEVRLGLGLSIGHLKFGRFNGTPWWDQNEIDWSPPPGENTQITHHEYRSYGPFILPEFSYHYKSPSVLALMLTLRLNIPTIALDAKQIDYYYADGSANFDETPINEVLFLKIKPDLSLLLGVTF